MQVHHNLDQLPNFKNSVITIGSFDGVHIGHLKIIQQIIQQADESDGESILITFDPHPRSVIYPKDDSLRLLSSLDEKIERLSKLGLDHVVVVPFTVEFSRQSPTEYIVDFLVRSFQPKHIVIGYDHRFGLNREGDIALLHEYQERFGFVVHEISKQSIEDIAVSSTKIRQALQQGDVDTANQYLGSPYMISGKVIHGEKQGAKIGFPTANIDPINPLKLIPSHGIYAVIVLIEKVPYDGMLYIGKKRTLSDLNALTIEVNIFDFNSNIYEKTIAVELISFIREDQNFDGVKSLIAQINQDKIDAQRVLNHRKELCDKKSETAIAILNYNNREYLESFLPHVSYSSTRDFDIIVIDNKSSDDSVEYLQEWHPEVIVIQLNKNYGFAQGYNEGLQGLAYKYIVLLNSDVLVTNGWLDTILSAMSKDESIAFAQPKILDLENKSQFEYAGASGGYMDMLNYPFCRGRIFDSIEEDQQQYDSQKEIFWASGAAMVMKYEIFKTLGGFDNDFFAHQEEIDLCWRARNCGYKVKVIPESKVYHLGGGTLSYENPKKTYLNFRNNHLAIFKNESLQGLLWKTPVRMILDFTALLQYVVKLKFKNAFSILKAYGYLITHLPSSISRRRITNNLIKNNTIGARNTSGRLNKSILFQYYLLRRKTYKAIVNEHE